MNKTDRQLKAAYTECLTPGTLASKQRVASFLVIAGQLQRTVVAPVVHLMKLKPTVVMYLTSPNELHGLVVVTPVACGYQLPQMIVRRKPTPDVAYTTKLVTLFNGSRLMFFARPDVDASFKLYDAPIFKEMLGLLELVAYPAVIPQH